MDEKPVQRPRSLARRINGIVSACIVVFFLAHGLLGSISAITGYRSSLIWLVWAGVACVVAHIVLSIITSRQQLTDTVRPPSDKKKRHLLLKWVSGCALALLVIAHIVSMRMFGAEAVQSSATGAALVIVLAIVLAVHLCLGAKSLLKDLGVDRRWRVAIRVTVCVVTAVIVVAELIALVI